MLSTFTLVGRGGGRGSNHAEAVWNLWQYPLLHFPVSFGGDTKCRRSLLSGVYARGSEIPHTWGKYVTCRGLHNSTWSIMSKRR